MYTYPVTIHQIFVSPGHNYDGRPKDGPGSAPTLDLAEVEAIAGSGLAGDRYAGGEAHHNAQVSFVAWEVFAALQAEFGHPEWSPIVMRRNVVIEGAPLNQLIGKPFVLDFGTYQVGFEGTRECAPCGWMDAMLADGAQAFLRGRGGLRARIVQGGLIRRGPATLICDFELSPQRASMRRPGAVVAG